MRPAPAIHPTVRLPVRTVLLGVVAVGLAMIGLALLAEAMASDGGTVYLANIDAGRGGRTGQPAIEVTGSGVARGPADRAVLQMLIVREVPFGSSTAPVGSATPDTAVPGQEGLELIVETIKAAGVDRTGIGVVSSPALISVCTGTIRCSSIRVDVTVEQPTLDRLNAIVDAVGTQATSLGLTVQDIGASYLVEDCAGLARAARAAAIADGRQRAADQAAALGVKLGNLLLSSEPTPPTPRDAHGCAMPSPSLGDSWWTAGSVGLTVPVFDPTASAEASATVQVVLVYAINGEAETSR